MLQTRTQPWWSEVILNTAYVTGMVTFFQQAFDQTLDCDILSRGDDTLARGSMQRNQILYTSRMTIVIITARKCHGQVTDQELMSPSVWWSQTFWSPTSDHHSKARDSDMIPMQSCSKKKSHDKVTDQTKMSPSMYWSHQLFEYRLWSSQLRTCCWHGFCFSMTLTLSDILQHRLQQRSILLQAECEFYD